MTLGNAQLDQLTTQTDLAAAEANLARLIGETGRVKAADDSAFYAVVPALDATALRAEAEAKSPRVQSAVANAAAARSSVSASRSAYWPTLALSGNTNWNGSQTNDYNFLNQRQLSLGLRWNLFDRFDRELAIAQREADRDVAEATAADARLGVAAELELRLAELDAARSLESRSPGPASSPPARISGCSRSATGWAPLPSWTCSLRRRRSTRRRSTW